MTRFMACGFAGEGRFGGLQNVMARRKVLCIEFGDVVSAHLQTAMLLEIREGTKNEMGNNSED